jgi:pimeloyl-ACP methyl ester carboxylesterase
MAIPDGPDVRTIDTSSGPVRVRDTGGGGRPLLLVHSLLVDPDLYGTLVPLLTGRGYRCVVPELPFGAHRLALRDGADLTPPGLTRLLVEVLDALGLPTVSVVGVDTGGALTQILMARHRDRVDAVVLTACDAYADFPPRSLVGRLLTPLFWPGALAVTAALTRSAAGRRALVPRPVTHRGVDDATLIRWTTPLRDPRIRRDTRAVLAGIHPRHTLAAARANRTFTRPVLIAWGDDDRLFRRRLAERLRRDLPNSRLVTIDDCGAFAAVDQPVRLAALIDEHLRPGGERAGGGPITDAQYGVARE